MYRNAWLSVREEEVVRADGPDRADEYRRNAHRLLKRPRVPHGGQVEPNGCLSRAGEAGEGRAPSCRTRSRNKTTLQYGGFCAAATAQQTVTQAAALVDALDTYLP